MGDVVSILLVVPAVTALALVSVSVFLWRVLLAQPPPPAAEEDAFWGPEEQRSQPEDTSVRPFKIDVSDEVLDDLRARLKLETGAETLAGAGCRLVPPLEGVGFEYGFNSAYLHSVAKHWLDNYDWRVREAALNAYPHFVTSINGIQVHFQHVKSTSTCSNDNGVGNGNGNGNINGNGARYGATRPLLLLHGWPDSIVTFQKVIPMLVDTKKADINFELVIPSLPGFGFSGRPHRPGLSPIAIACIFNKLMKRLGHEKYYVQGGDLGSITAGTMAVMYPNNLLGLHVNFCFSIRPKSLLKMLVASVWPTLFMSSEEARLAYPLKDIVPFLLEEGGYGLLQSTKPDTVGTGLSNSPIGLLAYILEKYTVGTNKEWRSKPNGGLEPHFQLDDLLDNIMIYWVTNSITTSIRLYKESLRVMYNLDRAPVLVPTRCLQAPQEVIAEPQWALKDKYKRMSYKIASHGGHFLAFEAPEVLASDVLSFFGSFEKSSRKETTSRINRMECV